MVQKLYSIFLLLISISYASGQEYLVHSYSVEDGLANSVVYDLAQAPDGRMWFATRSGLSVYDGFNWYNLKNDRIRKYHGFKRIDITDDGTIWLAQNFPWDGIWKLENNEFKKISWTRGGKYSDGIGHIITALAVNYVSGDTLIALGTIEHGLFFYRSGKWRSFDESNSPLGQNIYYITIHRDKFFIATNKGVVSYDGEKLEKTLEEASVPGRPPYTLIFEDSISKSIGRNRIWLAGRNWFGKIEDGRFTYKNFNYALPKFKTDIYPPKTVLLPDLAGGLIFGNYGKLFHYSLKDEHILQIGTRNDLGFDGATNLLRDREFNIWIANYRGVAKIPTLAWLTYRKGHGMLEDEVTAIIDHNKTDILFGHNQGLTCFRDGQRIFDIDFVKNHFQAPFLSRILSMATADPYTTLIAANASGLAKLRGNQFNWIFYDKNDLINTVFVDSKNRIWLSDYHGVGLMNGNQITWLREKGKPKHPIRSIREGSDGTIYFCGTANGMWTFKNDAWKNYSSFYVNQNNVYAVLPQESSLPTLVGTVAGLCKIQGDSITSFHDGFSISDAIFSINKDSKGRLWFGTDAGVYIWNGQYLRQITPREGLSGMETNRAAFLEDKHGRIWIGTNKGASCYRDEFDFWQQSKPEIKIHRIRAGEKIITDNAVSTVPYNDNDLNVKFSVISFRDENNIDLRYRLDGYDENDQWDYRIRQNTIYYHRLPPGRYQLRLQVRNVDGVFSDLQKSGWIEISLPFWSTWWFIMLSVLALGGALFLILRVFSERRYSRKLKKQIEIRTRQLRASEEKYRTIFEQSQDVVVISTEDGRILDINPAGIRLFGFQSRAQIERSSIPRDLYQNTEDRIKFQNGIEKTGYVRDFEVELKTITGKPITSLISSALNYDENLGCNVYISIIKDVTERWQIKEKLAQGQRLESIGMLAGGIAHDFNNILGGILGYASLLKLKTKESEPIYKYIDSIEQSAVRGADLTNQLLVFARRGESKLSQVNMNNVVKEGVKILKSTFPKNIELRITYGKNIPPIFADEGQLHQIMINLCVNARDAIQNNGIIAINTKRIFIDSDVARVYPDGSEGLFVVLEVIDNGLGMEQDVLQRIFEPFYTTKEQGKGTGLGLSMIYGFVRSHKGFIDVESSPGKGSAFRIFLPASEETYQEEKKKPSFKADTGRENILVVDDEVVLRDFLVQALGGYGYRVKTAENGEKALNILKKGNGKFDLVILDMIMPRMDGEETLRNIRKTNNDIPVIITSGYSDKEKFENVSELKIAGIIQKPFRIDKLLKQIRTILDNL